MSLPDRDGGSPDLSVGAIHLACICVTRPSHPGRSGDVRRGLLEFIPTYSYAWLLSIEAASDHTPGGTGASSDIIGDVVDTIYYYHITP